MGIVDARLWVRRKEVMHVGWACPGRGKSYPRQNLSKLRHLALAAKRLRGACDMTRFGAQTAVLARDDLEALHQRKKSWRLTLGPKAKTIPHPSRILVFATGSSP